MLSALHYVFNRADIIAERYGVKNLRLVINLSYGFSGGPHDGGIELEAAIDKFIETRRRRQGTKEHRSLGPSPTASNRKRRLFFIVGKVSADDALVQILSENRPHIIKRAEFEYD